LTTSRAAVLGSPIEHSLSPVLHRAAYDALGLDWSYDALEVDDRSLAEFLDRLDESWRGLSLTMPLKRVVLALLDEVSDLADTTKAVNTVTFDGRRRIGDNTDVHGIVAALNDAGVSTVGSGVVLGGGATATSAIAALKAVGETGPTVYVRNKPHAHDLLEAADRLGVTVTLKDWAAVGEIGASDVVISTTPRGATDTLELVDLPGERSVLLDVVYEIWPTPLASQWQERGGTVIGGLTMLVHQAGRQVELMTGHAAPLAAMRAAGEAALAART
jgi:shikimate dehydrogenase